MGNPRWGWWLDMHCCAGLPLRLEFLLLLRQCSFFMVASSHQYSVGHFPMVANMQAAD